VLPRTPDAVFGELLQELVHVPSLEGGTAVVDRHLLFADGGRGRAAGVRLLGLGGDRDEREGRRGQGNESLHYRFSSTGLNDDAGRRRRAKARTSPEYVTTPGPRCSPRPALTFERFLQQAVHDLGIRFSARPPHHLSHEPAEGRRLALAVRRDLLG